MSGVILTTEILVHDLDQPGGYVGREGGLRDLIGLDATNVGVLDMVNSSQEYNGGKVCKFSNFVNMLFCQEAVK